MDRVRLIGVETSSPTFSVALSEGEKILCFFQSEGQGRPSLRLADLIRQAAQTAGIKLSDLDGFAVSIGPGSFTGLRVGVMTVKALAWALQKPVVPVSSLEIVAQNAWDFSGGEILLFVDARKGKVYSARFLSEGRFPVKRLTPDRLVLPEEALGDTPGRALLLGDGAGRYEALVRSIPQDRLTTAPAAVWVPRADFLCRLAQGRFSSGRVDDPHRLVPEYLYSKEGMIQGNLGFP